MFLVPNYLSTILFIVSNSLHFFPHNIWTKYCKILQLRQFGMLPLLLLVVLLVALAQTAVPLFRKLIALQLMVPQVMRLLGVVAVLKQMALCITLIVTWGNTGLCTRQFSHISSANLHTREQVEDPCPKSAK